MMGITCKPFGKNKSIIVKLENKIARERAEKIANRRSKNTKEQ